LFKRERKCSRMPARCFFTVPASRLNGTSRQRLAQLIQPGKTGAKQGSECTLFGIAILKVDSDHVFLSSATSSRRGRMPGDAGLRKRGQR
jgi:hypothetical protein